MHPPEARGPDDDAGHELEHDGRQPQPRHEAEREGRGERDGADDEQVVQ